MPTTTRFAREKQKTASIRDAVVLSEDLLFVILMFTNFLTLVRVQRVCTHWKLVVSHMMHAAVLGKIPFSTKKELCTCVREYCGNDQIQCADEIARSYGWPIGKWDVPRLTSFRRVFVDQHDFNEDIGGWAPFGMFREATSFHHDYDPLFNDDL